MRSASLYLTPATARDCQSAAQLAGLDSGDAWAEMTLRTALDKIPEVAELNGKISYAIKSTREKYLAGKQAAASPAQAAGQAIADATT